TGNLRSGHGNLRSGLRNPSLWATENLCFGQWKPKCPAGHRSARRDIRAPRLAETAGTYVLFPGARKRCICVQAMQLFTTSEAAAYLRLKERKIYEMVAEGTVPCTKVTGRWLFPKAELDRWLAASVHRPAGMRRADPAPIVGGSHDPLLEWALRESGSGLAQLAVGSEAGLARFAAGETAAAAIHLHALEDPGADANAAAMAARSDMQDAVLIAFCRREQGFLVAPGNPLKIAGIADAHARRARLALRPPGAGAQLLLL